MCVLVHAGIMQLGAQTPDWDWAAQAGGTSSERCFDIATDKDGNSYVTGYFFGTATFGSTTLTCAFGGGAVNYPDIFVAKMDASGHWVWAKRAGGTDSDNGVSIALDAEGNSYVAGYFQGSSDFGSHVLECTPSGLPDTVTSDVFVAKLDSSGNWLWAAKAGSTNAETCYGIAVDQSGNSFVTGWFKGGTRFGTNSLKSFGEDDIFVAKLDPLGTEWLWCRQAGAAKSDNGRGIAVDPAGSCYITGHFTSTVSFGSIQLVSHGGSDVFVSKLDTDGNWLWANRGGGTDWDYSSDIAVDEAGEAYVTGSFYGSPAEFGSISLTGSGGDDLFIGKLDSSGAWLWARSAGGTGMDSGVGICLDNALNCLVAGDYTGKPGFGTHSLTNCGSRDIFVAKADSLGNWLWAQRAGGTGPDFANAIAVDGAGNGHMTGYFEAAAAWGATILTSGGGSDVFVSSLPVSVLTRPTLAISLLGGTPLLSWTAVPGAVSYKVYGSADPASGFSFLTSTDTTTYSHTGVEPRLFFKVSAVFE